MTKPTAQRLAQKIEFDCPEMEVSIFRLRDEDAHSYEVLITNLQTGYEESCSSEEQWLGIDDDSLEEQ